MHKLLITCTAAGAIVIGLLAFTISRTHAATPPLSDKEKLALRTAQTQLLTAQQQLSQSKEWQTLQSAQAELNHAVDIVYSTRKVTRDAYVLCDGLVAGQPACAGLQAGELALRPVPAAPAPAKK